jgi:bifunctional ADP-heptose synthase (sugar kinase/adenylyltransferase)
VLNSINCLNLKPTNTVILIIWKKARQLGDRLVVAVNSDASVQVLKGSTRPKMLE